MKKLLIILSFLTIGTVLHAQNRAFVQTGISTSEGVTYENFKLGGTSGKNRLAAVLETYNSGNDLSVRSDREYSAGLEYTRVKPITPSFDLLLSTAALIHLDHDKAITVEPGAGVSWNPCKTLSLIANVSSPFRSRDLVLSPSFKAGAGLKINL